MATRKFMSCIKELAAMGRKYKCDFNYHQDSITFYFGANNLEAASLITERAKQLKCSIYGDITQPGTVLMSADWHEMRKFFGLEA